MEGPLKTCCYDVFNIITQFIIDDKDYLNLIAACYEFKNRVYQRDMTSYVSFDQFFLLANKYNISRILIYGNTRFRSDDQKMNCYLDRLFKLIKENKITKKQLDKITAIKIKNGRYNTLFSELYVLFPNIKTVTIDFIFKKVTIDINSFKPLKNLIY